MELVDGPDLRPRISTRPLSPLDVAHFGADLADALHYVHDRGVLHRDIKPANVLLAPPASRGARTHAKLTDFGIARQMDDETRLTATNATIGTATYFSPEQAEGGPLTGASDVYSLGLVLLECLTGTKAFPGEATPSAIARLTRDPEIPSTLGADWVALLARMTAREASARPTAAFVANALGSLNGAVSPSGPRSDSAVASASDTRVPDEATLLYPQATEVLPRGEALAAAAAAHTRPSLSRTRILTLTALALALLIAGAVGVGSAIAPASQTPDVLQPVATSTSVVTPSPTQSVQPTAVPSKNAPGNSGKNNDKKAKD